jgi:hypothetical protein
MKLPPGIAEYKAPCLSCNRQVSSFVCFYRRLLAESPLMGEDSPRIQSDTADMCWSATEDCHAVADGQSSSTPAGLVLPQAMYLRPSRARIGECVNTARPAPGQASFPNGELPALVPVGWASWGYTKPCLATPLHPEVVRCLARSVVCEAKQGSPSA